VAVFLRSANRRRLLAVLAACILMLGFTSTVSGTSHMFTITSPTAASVWFPGSTVTITWTGGSTSTLVNQSLVDVNAWAVYTTIASAIPNNGSFTWTVPATAPAGSYLVYIENVERTTWTYGQNFPIESGKGKPDLAIAKKPEGPLQAGQPGAYMVMVTNVGSGPASGPIVVTDTLGAGLTFVSATGAGWTCSNSGQTVTCSNPGPLPANSSLPAILITVNVAKDAEKVENCASVMMEGQQDANSANNRTCIGTPTEPPLTGSVCGVKFEDKNGNGAHDPGEALLPGWTMVLLDAAGNIVASVVTGANGEYCFKGLPMGTYTLGETNQAGWSQTYPSTGTYTLTLASTRPDVKGFDFGNQRSDKPGIICGVKFEDKNGNGVQDPGEPGLAGWTIQMVDSAGNIVGAVVTGAGGKFCFKEVKPGTYTFGEVMQPNWSQTYPAAPGTYTVTVNPGQNSQLLVFGNRPGKDPCCLTFKFPAGKADVFATTDGLEAAAPSPALAASLPGTLSAIFDGTVTDRYFAHTFTLPQGNCIRSARLEIKARPLGYGSTVANDSMALRFTGVTGSPTWGSYFGSGNANPGLVANPWKLPTYGSGQLFTLDLSNLPGGGNLIGTLNSQRFLDMYVQDDTAVDYMLLTVEFCECAKQSHGKSD